MFSLCIYKWIESKEGFIVVRDGLVDTAFASHAVGTWFEYGQDRCKQSHVSDVGVEFCSCATRVKGVRRG